MKFVYNEKRALLEQGILEGNYRRIIEHLDTCNHYSYHFIRFPGGSNPWKKIYMNVPAIFLIHPAITCSKLTIETLEKSVKYVQS